MAVVMALLKPLRFVQARRGTRESTRPLGMGVVKSRRGSEGIQRRTVFREQGGAILAQAVAREANHGCHE
jgi:hypothetical protein